MNRPKSPTAWTEADRLSALRAYDILDTGPEPAFDDICRLAARLCDAPMAVICLIDGDRQWFKARVGISRDETERDLSFCDHAMREGGVLIVPDAREDPRFSTNAFVTGSPDIRFYAGAPLRSPEGIPLGSLSVMDVEPRPEGLTEVQLQAVEVLARQVVMQMELRRTVDRLRASEANFRAITDAMPQMVWSARPDGAVDYCNSGWYDFFGVEEGVSDGWDWTNQFHPDDRERAAERWRHSIATGEPYEIEYRMRHRSGVYRWGLGRGQPTRNEKGEITRWFGTCTDIDDLKRAEQSKELVSQELSHRIKNIFAVITALIALSARRFPEAKDFAAALKTRINALSRAHEFVRPHSDASAPTVGPQTLHAFLTDLFAAYVDDSGAPRVRISGDDASFDDQAATSVALLFHELATNAAKYGALSTPRGRVDLVTSREDERFILRWTESGGPPVTEPPERNGFGSSLAHLSVGQLGGELEQVWASEGLRVIADLPATALSRRRVAQKVA